MEPTIVVAALAGASLVNVVVAAVASWLRHRHQEIVVRIQQPDGRRLELTEDQLRSNEELREAISRLTEDGESGR